MIVVLSNNEYNLSCILKVLPQKISKENGLKLEMVVDMPSNNKTLVFRRLPPSSESDKLLLTLPNRNGHGVELKEGCNGRL